MKRTDAGTVSLKNVSNNSEEKMSVKTKKSIPKPIGPYSIAREFKNLIFTSGQIGVDPETGEMAGSVEAQTEQVFRNLGAVLETRDCSFENVIKATVFLSNMDDFATMNSVYERFFTRDFPARSAVEVARLPKDALVEIEVIAAREESDNGIQ